MTGIILIVDTSTPTYVTNSAFYRLNFVLWHHILEKVFLVQKKVSEKKVGAPYHRFEAGTLHKK